MVFSFKRIEIIAILALVSLTTLWVNGIGGDNLRRIREINELENPPLRKRIVKTPFPGTEVSQSLEVMRLVDGEYDTLMYDSGEPISAFYWFPGYRMAVRMSLDTSQTECKIIAVEYYHWIPGAFHPAIYGWSGSSPSDTLLEWEDTSTVAGFNTFWVDTAEIMVDGEDFVVSHGCVDTITALGYDNYNNGRAWDFNPVSATWAPYIETYFIRAIVEYPPYGAVPPNIDVLTPQSVVLEAPYPNPFNPVTNFTIHRNRSGPMSLKIYDLLGREVKTLINGYCPMGTIRTSWKADDYSSGIYWAVLVDRSDRVVQKVVLLK